MKLNITNLIRFATIGLLAAILSPFLIKLLPFPFSSTIFHMTLFVGCVLIANPSVFISKDALYVYLWVVIYSFGIHFFWSDRQVGYGDPIDYDWLVKTIGPLFLSILVFNLYIRRKDFRGLGILSLIIFGLIVINSVYYIIIVNLNPEMIRGAVIRDDYGQLENTSLGYSYFYGLAVILPVFGYYIKDKYFFIGRKKIKILLILSVVLIFLSLIKAQFVTAFIVAATSFVLALIAAKNFNRIFLFMGFVLFILVINSAILADVIFFSTDFLGEGLLKERLIDFGTAISIKDFATEGGSTYTSTVRLAMLPPLFSSILSNPIIGGGVSSGHAFWFDQFSMFGVVGLIPWILIIRYQIVRNLKLFSNDFKPYYLLSVYSYLLMGFIKGGLIALPSVVFVFFVSPSFYFVISLLKDNGYMPEQNKIS